MPLIRQSTGRSPAALAGSLAVAGMLAFGAAPASADHHFIDIREVFAGAAGQPSAQFVELQMYAFGQHVVAGRRVEVYSAAGTAVGTFTFSANMANPANQSSILIATPQAASFFGVTPNLLMTPAIQAAGGKVCFIGSNFFGVIDCMSWGSYSGPSAASPSAGTGTPFNAAGGLVAGKSAERDISGGTNPGALDGVDDTDDSAADFDFANPSPRNNAGATTTTAGTAGVAAGSLDFTAAATSSANRVTVTGPSGGFFTLRDTGAPMNPGAGCQRLTVNEVRCSSAGVTRITVDTGAGNDTVNVSAALPTRITGGTGNDSLTSGNAADTLLGGDGVDNLVALGGGDTLEGGAQDDTLNGGTGPDILRGGAGIDTVTYSSRTATVVVDIDGVSDDGGSLDGPAGARDRVVTDVERLVGGSGPDTLIGSAGGNRLTGGLGADVLRGLGGNDTLLANDGVADTELTCDGGLPAGTADVARVDAADPAPTGCETVAP
jgi:hypothetical protein